MRRQIRKRLHKNYIRTAGIRTAPRYAKGVDWILKKVRNRLLGTASLMVLLTLLAKLLGMLRDILLANNFGTSMPAVAYEAASRLPITLFDFALGGVVTAAFIPIFNELLVKDGKTAAFDFANRYFNLILLITTAMTLLGVLFSEPLVSFLAPQINAQTKELAAALSRIMFPMLIFTGAAYCYVGILQSFERYMLPALMSLVSNLIMVLYFFTFCDQFGVWGLSVALVIGWGLQAAILAPAAHRLGFRFRPTLSLNDSFIRRAVKMAIPILVCSWLQPFCNIINTRYASGFANGSAITMVSYANRLYIMIVGIFSFVATNLLFPKFAQAEARGDIDCSRNFARASIKTLLLIMLPIAAGIFVLAEPFTRAIYMRGEFTAEDAQLTASVLQLFSLGIPFMSVNEVLTKLFFARQKVTPPMLASLLSILANLLLVELLVRFTGFDGIGLASAITIAFCATLNYIFLPKEHRPFRAADIPDLLKIVVYTAVMGTCVYFLNKALAFNSDILHTAVCAACGALIYAGLLFLFPTEEFRIVKYKLLKRKVNRD